MGFVLSSGMAEESGNEQSTLDKYVASLKAKIPAMEHGALDSRLEELLNDSSADENDVISILHQEYDPPRR